MAGFSSAISGSAKGDVWTSFYDKVKEVKDRPNLQTFDPPGPFFVAKKWQSLHPETQETKKRQKLHSANVSR